MTIGFIGLGVMGRPMAARLARSGAELAVWSRTTAHCQEVVSLGARPCVDPGEVFAIADQAVILMLADEASTDTVLGRGAHLAAKVRGRTVINMGTMTPSWSAQRARDVHQAGGVWVEAPVSGSRGPAEAGALVAMIAGEADALALAREIISPCCRDIFDCGTAPSALRMKLAVNLFLITLVTGLVEATHFAQRVGLDLEAFSAIIGAGPMSSRVSHAKLDKLLAEDFSVQASIRDVLKNSRLVEAATADACAAAPLISVCTTMYESAVDLGIEELDMAAVLRAFEARSSRLRGAA